MNSDSENGGYKHDDLDKLGSSQNPSELPRKLAPEGQTMSSVEETPVIGPKHLLATTPKTPEGSNEARIKTGRSRSVCQGEHHSLLVKLQQQTGNDNTGAKIRLEGELPVIDSNTLPGPAPSTPKAGKKAREARTKKRSDHQARQAQSITPGGHCSRIRNGGEIYTFSPISISPVPSSNTSSPNASFDSSSCSSSASSPANSLCSPSPTPTSTAKHQSQVFTKAGKLAVEKEIRNLEKEQRKEFRVKDKDLKRAAELNEDIKKVKNEKRLKHKQVEKIKNKIQLGERSRNLEVKLKKKRSEHQKLKGKLMELQMEVDGMAIKEKPVVIKDREMSPLHHGRLPGQLDPLFKGYDRLIPAPDPNEQDTQATSLEALEQERAWIPKPSKHPSTSESHQRRAIQMQITDTNAGNVAEITENDAKVKKPKKNAHRRLFAFSTHGSQDNEKCEPSEVGIKVNILKDLALSDLKVDTLVEDENQKKDRFRRHTPNNMQNQKKGLKRKDPNSDDQLLSLDSQPGPSTVLKKARVELSKD